jgi:SAM-dependent methyltransferase
MTSEEISQYFDATKYREVRDDLVFSVSKIDEPKIAIDCGCGAGADIEYLSRNGFIVHGFDIEDESISKCQTRFRNNENVFLSKASFSTFEYPDASLIVADASLFFCSPSDFEEVWSNIYHCLLPSGIFCGSFLGNEDTMAVPGDNPSVFWPHVTAFEEAEVIALFRQYEVLRFNTHKSSAVTSQGVPHNWHIFQVVAQKPNKSKHSDAASCAGV